MKTKKYFLKTTALIFLLFTIISVLVINFLEVDVKIISIIIVIVTVANYIIINNIVINKITDPLEKIIEYTEEYVNNQNLLDLGELELDCNRLYMILENSFKSTKDIMDGQNSQIHSVTRLNNKIKFKEEMLQTIFHISTEIAKGTNLDEMLQVILDKAVYLSSGVNKGCIILVKEGDEDKKDNDRTFTFRAIVGYENEIKDIELHGRENYVLTQVEFKKAFTTRNTDHLSRFLINDERAEILQHAGLKDVLSTLGVPIIIKEKIYGVIYLDSTDEKHIFDEDSKQLIEYLGIQISIAVEHAMLLDKIVYLSKYDSLTGLLNRTEFRNVIETNYNRAKRYKETFCIVNFDIKGLAKMNENFGNTVGDNVLQGVSDVIKNSVRQTDYVARVGGDEISVLLINLSREDAMKKAINIKENVEDTDIFTGYANTKVKLSFGCAYYPEDGDNPQKLMILAESLKNANSTGGKNVISS